MADLVTVSGGAKSGISTLSAAEHHAALKALSKLGSTTGATQGVASVLGGSNLTSATLSGGSVHGQVGSDTFAGGVHSGVTPAFTGIGSDTVVAGSAFSSKAETTQATGTSAHALSLSSSDTINVAGTTAASVKTETTPDSKAGHTITLSDKTTITLTGVSTHDVTKPH
jgi:hypothetical protein